MKIYFNYCIIFPTFRKVLLFFSSLLFPLFSHTQNLVNNPSFETAAWADANTGSVDWLTGPTNVFGTENARTGTRYMGESMGRSPAGGATDFREYIKNSLTAALIPSNTYECSIWVSLSENYGSYACNKIGFVTTNVNPFYAFSNAPIPLTPVYAAPAVITNKTGWTQVVGTFVATSADTWVMVGNFNSVASTTWSYVGPATGFYYGYYFMDDVCLGPPGACGVILPVEMLSFEGKLINRNVILNWKTATELNCDYFIAERSTDGKTFEAIGKTEGNGTSNQVRKYDFTDIAPVYGKTNYYRLKEVDFKGKTQYSNIIAIEPTGEMNSYLNVFPVPSDTKINIELDANGQNSILMIYNAEGEMVFNKANSGHSKVTINQLIQGNYAAVLIGNDGTTITKKFIITE